jgi:hypothetical protein
MRRTALFPALLLAVGTLAACSKPAPPVGRWEGGFQSNSTIVAARVEVMKDGQVRLSAPDITNLDMTKPERVAELRQQLASDLANGWDSVAPRPFDFDGETFRKPGGYAPQMVWDKNTGQMTLELYIGANPALPVPLRPVPEFHDDPWVKG